MDILLDNYRYATSSSCRPGCLSVESRVAAVPPNGLGDENDVAVELLKRVVLRCTRYTPLLLYTNRWVEAIGLQRYDTAQDELIR